jgi:hypothetical protein
MGLYTPRTPPPPPKKKHTRAATQNPSNSTQLEFCPIKRSPLNEHDVRNEGAVITDLLENKNFHRYQVA